MAGAVIQALHCRLECGINDNHVARAGQLIRTLISAAAPDAKAEEDATARFSAFWSARWPTRSPTNWSRRASALPPSFADWNAIASICHWLAPVTSKARKVRLGRRTVSKLEADFSRRSMLATITKTDRSSQAGFWRRTHASREKFVTGPIYARVNNSKARIYLSGFNICIQEAAESRLCLMQFWLADFL